MSRIRIYVTLIAAGACTIGIAHAFLHPQVTGSQIEALTWFVVLAVIAQLQAHRLPSSASGSIAFLPLTAAALIAPNWLTILATAVAHAVAEATRKRSPMKAIFNVAQVALSISIALFAYTSLGGQSLLAVGSQPFVTVTRVMIVPLVALVMLYFAINTLLVSGAIALDSERSFLDVWRSNTLSTLLYDVLSAPIIFVFAWTYVKFGPLGALGLALPLMGARQLYKTNRQLETVNQELLELMVKAIEARDPYTSGHSRRVAHYSRIIARALGMNTRQIDRVTTAALLHDVGKIHEVFAPILQKPGKLTADEWAIMQTHPIKSAELVATVSHLSDLVSAVRHHHENWDGSGYPDGLAGEAIPIESRIIMFADTVDAMTSDRPYRAALGEADVRSELHKLRGRQFDPNICDELLSSTLFSLLFVPKPSPVSGESVQPSRETIRVLPATGTGR